MFETHLCLTLNSIFNDGQKTNSIPVLLGTLVSINNHFNDMATVLIVKPQ